MRKHKRFVALLLSVQLIAWFIGSAQTNPYEQLPEGFPIDQVTYLENNSFTSPAFGDFQLDPSVDNRVIHEVFGPFIWEWDDNTKVVTINSEWWGTLKTCWEADKDTAGLGIAFPYVKSEMTGSVYLVDPTGSTSTPFYNHSLDASNNPIGWQSAIGVNLNDSYTYYVAAQTSVNQMQEQVSAMVAARDELAAMPVAVGNNNIELKRQQVIDLFTVMDRLYSKNYLYYRHRLILSPQWVSSMGGGEAEVVAAQNWVTQLPALTQMAQNVYVNGQTVLYSETEAIYATKVQQRAALGQQSSGNSSNGSSSGSSGSSSGSSNVPAGGKTFTENAEAGSGWQNPEVVGPVAKGAFGWPQSIKLEKVVINNGRIYFPCASRNWEVVQTGSKPSTGNVWLIQKVGSKYYASTIDFFRDFNRTYPRVMEDHLPEIDNMSFRVGDKYGLMVTSVARNSYERFVDNDVRSNIILFTML